MHPDLLEILKTHTLPIENETLIKYLNGQLTPEETQKVEYLLAEGGPDAVAIEGLRHIKPAQLSAYQQELHLFIQSNTGIQNRKSRRPIAVGILGLMVFTGLLLLLAIAIWFVIQGINKP